MWWPGYEDEPIAEILFECGHGIHINCLQRGRSNDTFLQLRQDGDYYDVGAWRRLGRAFVRLSNDSHFTPTAECIRAFYRELKNNTTIKYFRLQPINQVLMFDLRYFLRNNTDMKNLILCGVQTEPFEWQEPLEWQEPVTPRQSNIVSTALTTARLRELDITRCAFQNNGSFEQIISACLGVEELVVHCLHDSQYTALATLLRDPRTILKWLTISDMRGNMRLGLGEIVASLAFNTTLSHLMVVNSQHPRGS